MKNKNKKGKKKFGKKFSSAEDTPRIPGFKKRHKEKGLSKSAIQALEINAIANTSIDRVSDIDIEVWCKWTLLNVLHHDIQWLFAHLKETIRFVFNPINIKKEGQNVIFFVQMSNKTIQDARKDLLSFLEPQSGKRIIVNIVQVPTVGPVDLTEEGNKEHVKECLRRRFKQTSTTIEWNLNSLQSDSYLFSVNIVADLCVKTTVTFVVDTICENITELHQLNLSNNRIKTLSQFKPLFVRFPMLLSLDISHNEIANFEKENFQTLTLLRDLNLDDTPFYSRWLREKSKLQLQSHLLTFLPSLVTLNNCPVQMTEIEEIKKKENVQLPERQIAFFCQPSLQDGLLLFIQSFLNNIDTDRRALLNAYNDNSIFTFHCCQHDLIGNVDKVDKELFRFPSNLTTMHNRNLLRCQDAARRRDCVKKGGIQVVAFMQSFPLTKHILLEDKGTFQIDVPICTENFMHLHFQGVYWERQNENATAVLRHYSRNLFIVEPNQIINDDWFVTTPTLPVRQNLSSTASVADKQSNAVVVAAAVHSSSSSHDSLITKLCEVTGMNRPFSHKCLEDFQWNFDLALTKFHELNNSGLLPSSAFA